MITVTFVGQDGTTVVGTTKVVYNTPYGEIDAPTTIPTTDGYKFNGLWYSSITGTSPVSATAKLTSDKTYYPGLIAPMTDIAGTWIGANSKGVSYTMVVNAADQTVAITTVNGETTEELDIKSILFKLFATSTPTTKLVVRYLPAGESESEKMLTLTYKDNGTFTGDNSLVLEKQGVTKYDVTFNSDGGSEVAAQSVEDGAVATEPTAPTKDGFDFVGWFLEGSEVAYDFATPVTSAITLTAKWTEKMVTYTVTFDTGNAATTTTQNVVEGECVVAPENPSKSGYTFMGWYNGDVKFDLTTPITTNLVLTSKFGYAVTFYNQAKEIVKEMVLESGSVIPESEIPEPSINDGYIFAGTWHKSYTVSAAPVDLTAPITGATKLYPGVIKESIATELAGTWTGEKDGKTYTFKIEVSKDTENKVTAVTVTVISCGDIEIDYEKIFSYQYNTSSTYTQLCIKYFKKNSTSTSPSSFAINYYSDGTVKLGSPAIILTKVVESTPEA